MQPELHIFNLSQTFVLLHDLRFLASYLTITLLPFCMSPAEQIFTFLKLQDSSGKFLVQVGREFILCGMIRIFHIVYHETGGYILLSWI